MRIAAWKSRLAVGAVAALALTACAGGADSGREANTDSLNIATLTVPQSFDPTTAIGSSLPFFQTVYDTLLKREPDGTFSPMLATEWTLDPARTRLSLTLREGVKFADGTPFDANTVKANLDRFKTTQGSNTRWLTDLDAVDVVDGTHVDLTLKQPNPAMLFYLSDAAGLMANPARFAQQDGLKAAPDGTGPYNLDKGKTVIGTKWAYERKADYWGTALPYKSVTINVFDNETAIVNGVKTGQIDAALLQLADQQIGIESDSRVKTVKQEIDFQGILLFDRDGKVTPELKDPRVRQAVNHALDRATMLAQLRQGRGTATSQVFGPTSSGYKPELDNYYAHDPAKAKALLAEAGYGNGFTLKLPRVATIVNDALASSLQTDLKAVGINLEWEQVEPAKAIDRIIRGREFPGMVMNLGQSSQNWVIANDWVSPGPFNIFGTTDPTIQELMGKLKTETGDAEKAAAQALNQHLVENAWFVPFYRMSYLHVTDGSVVVTPQDGMAVPSIYNYKPAK
ncbi:ABC transporter substrate-binding protein [Yinghuangia sp. YIM S09857]|uniref:ABC transporter substrate-binding protein n=1 Tax=Yinghuangia sp. YIM S09857 TaxID=3436929 RepID=UPI003F538426